MVLLRTDSLPSGEQWLYELMLDGYRRLHEGTKTFDALIFGYYEGHKLIYVARTRNGFTPVVRAQLFRKFRRP